MSHSTVEAMEKLLSESQGLQERLRTADPIKDLGLFVDVMVDLRTFETKLPEAMATISSGLRADEQETARIRDCVERLIWSMREGVPEVQRAAWAELREHTRKHRGDAQPESRDTVDLAPEDERRKFGDLLTTSGLAMFQSLKQLRDITGAWFPDTQVVEGAMFFALLMYARKAYDELHTPDPNGMSATANANIVAIVQAALAPHGGQLRWNPKTNRAELLFGQEPWQPI